MHNSVFKFCLIFFIAVILISGCKKYEQDEKRYYKTPCGRIAKKWELYKITDKDGRDITDSLIYYKIPDNKWALIPEQSFTYRNLMLEFDRSKNKLCLETGIRGNVTILNKPFSSGYYEIKFKRTKFKFDLRPHENTPTRYFIDDYTIYKMTSDELIFGQEWNKMRAFFTAAH